jgi:predicted Holliday junction resolvase-like endonuclease
VVREVVIAIGGLLFEDALHRFAGLIVLPQLRHDLGQGVVEQVVILAGVEVRGARSGGHECREVEVREVIDHGQKRWGAHEGPCVLSALNDPSGLIGVDGGLH